MSASFQTAEEELPSPPSSMVTCDTVPVGSVNVTSACCDGQKGSKINQVGQYLLSRLEQRCNINGPAAVQTGEQGDKNHEESAKNSRAPDSSSADAIDGDEDRRDALPDPAPRNKLSSGVNSAAGDDQPSSTSGQDVADRDDAQCPLSLTGGAFKPNQYCNGLETSPLSQPHPPRQTQHSAALIVPKKRKSPPAGDDSFNIGSPNSSRSPGIHLPGSGSTKSGSSATALVLETPTSTVIVTAPALVYSCSKNCSPAVMSLGAHHAMPLTIPQYVTSSLCYQGVSGSSASVHIRYKYHLAFVIN